MGPVLRMGRFQKQEQKVRENRERNKEGKRKGLIRIDGEPRDGLSRGNRKERDPGQREAGQRAQVLPGISSLYPHPFSLSKTIPLPRTDLNSSEQIGRVKRGSHWKEEACGEAQER